MASLIKIMIINGKVILSCLDEHFYDGFIYLKRLTLLSRHVLLFLYTFWTEKGMIWMQNDTGCCVKRTNTLPVYLLLGNRRLAHGITEAGWSKHKALGLFVHVSETVVYSSLGLANKGNLWLGINISYYHGQVKLNQHVTQGSIRKRCAKMAPVPLFRKQVFYTFL